MKKKEKKSSCCDVKKTPCTFLTNNSECTGMCPSGKLSAFFSYAFLEFLLIITSDNALEWHYKAQSLFQMFMLPSSIHV